MAVLLVTYDLVAPGRNYQPLFDYIKANYTWCKGLESVWLLDTKVSPAALRDELKKLVDGNDKIFVVRLSREWASVNYYCGEWLNSPERDF